MWLLVTIQDSTDAEVEINNPKTQREALHQGPTQSCKTSDTERLTMPEGQGEEMVASKWPEDEEKSVTVNALWVWRGGEKMSRRSVLGKRK